MVVVTDERLHQWLDKLEVPREYRGPATLSTFRPVVAEMDTAMTGAGRWRCFTLALALFMLRHFPRLGSQEWADHQRELKRVQDRDC